MKTDRMPVLFIGHGSPMNAIETNSFSLEWQRLGREIPKPKKILAISAHWFTDYQAVRTAKENRQINDMYGFPEELYNIHYTPSGDKPLADKVISLTNAKADNNWGIDHGVWAVLYRMYPNADIPVVMLSTDLKAESETLYERGKALRSLREEGVLIVASGNVVHNLALCNYEMENKGYPWAIKYDEEIAKAVKERDKEVLFSFSSLENSSKAFNSEEHFRPLLYAVGAADKDDKVTTVNMKYTYGALSMTSFVFN